MQKKVVQWLPNTVLYEVNIRQFTPEGTFAAFMPHLPRLQQMGINTIWLMPIQPIGNKHRKGTLGSYYSIKDYTGINYEFGSLNDFKLLVDEAHFYEIKVIIDWVANHTSWDHNWVKENPSYYALNNEGKMYAPNDWSDVVQLNHQNEVQQNAMAEAMYYWVTETNIDGFRCDMAHLVPIKTWQKARQLCETKRPLLWLAETQDSSYFKVFDIIYSWEFMHAMQKFYKNEIAMEQLQSTFLAYQNDCLQNQFRILFTSNHDENTWQGTEYQRLGNSAIAFASICCLLPGIPLLYNGQEEPLMEQLPFFDKKAIEWKNYTLHNFYESILHLKSKYTCHNVNFSFLQNNHSNKIFAFMLKNNTKTLVIVANLSNDVLTTALTDNKLFGNYQKIFEIVSITQKITLSATNNSEFWSANEAVVLLPWQIQIFVK